MDIDEAKRMLSNVIPFRLGLIERGETVDSSCHVIKEACEEVAATLESLRAELDDATQAKQNVCSLLDQALEQNERLKVELEEARKLLAHAVKEADGWHDECRGGPIQDDPLIEAARQPQGNDRRKAPRMDFKGY
jgi:chromosome segregation ATPase